MNVEADAVVPFARDAVFQAYRDELPNLVEHLPNVRTIQVEERVDDGAVTKLVNVWHGGGEIPGALRKFVSESMLSWHDYATWNENDFTCSWNIETHAFRDAVNCTGQNRFVELEGQRTRLEIQGELHIDLKRVRGVPSIMAGSLGRSIEQLLVKQITSNLTDVSEGLRRYLESKG